MKNNYYSKLPNAVRYDRTLTFFQKVLYSEIALLAGVRGYCWASNKHLGLAFGVHDKHVSKAIKGLCVAGYIRVEMCKEAGNTRRLFVVPIDSDNEIMPAKTTRGSDDFIDVYMQHNAYLASVANLASNAEIPSSCELDAPPIYIEENRIKNNNLKEIKKKESARAGTNSQSKAVTPPTLCDVQKYISEKNLSVNAQSFFDYYEAGNWVDGNGKKVISWKQKLITWANSNHNSKNKNTTGGKQINYDEE